jgi:cardiolipin synthase (CMP-forming)
VFIEEYLQDLRHDGFSLPAFGRYAIRVVRRVREGLIANPGAVRAIWSTALAFFAVAFIGAAAVAVLVDHALAYRLLLWTSVWILGAFGIVTAGIELLRDSNGYRLPALNVPLVLTLSRIALVPAIALFVEEERFVAALVVYLFAALSDVADGYLARRLKQVTALGTVLDPIVDVVFNFALFAGLAGARLLPMWVFLAVAVRYGVLTGGATFLYVFVGPVRIRPTTLGRFSGVLTSALVAFLIVLHLRGGAWSARLEPLTGIALGVLLTGTVLHVLVLGWYNLRVMRGQVPEQGRVVGDVRWGKQ